MRKRLSTIFLLAGSAALVWCFTVWAGATLFEKYEGWRWSTRHAQAHESRIAAEVNGKSATPRSPVPHEVVAWLEVPRLNISTAVLEGDDALALRLGAGHIPGTPLPGATGNIGIAAHRDSFFRSLSGIQPKDRIRLDTPEGAWEYTVESTRIVQPSNIGVLAASNDPELTLVTCYPFTYVGSAPLRFIVRAHRTG
jgi:sortase A